MSLNFRMSRDSNKDPRCEFELEMIDTSFSLLLFAVVYSCPYFSVQLNKQEKNCC